MTALNLTRRFTSFETPINDGVNLNFSDVQNYVNDRDAGVAAWGDLRWPHYGCRVYNNANITIPTSVDTALTYNSERYDSFGMHSVSTNTGRLTATRAGKYHIFSHVEFAANAAGFRRAYLRVNGSTIIAIDISLSVTTADQARVNLSTIYQLNLNDYVETIARQDSGGDLTVFASANLSPEFGMMYVGD